METLSIFDLMPEDESKKYKPIKSTDWRWTMKDDYPKEKNGLKVFSCFACGGGYTWVNYICGMSVPPIMIKRIVTRLIESGVFPGIEL